MSFEFHKYHGTGNDFILVDDRNLEFPADNHALISDMCHRRFGIGGDGLILLQNHPDVDFAMKYYNSDGIEGSMCGNGGRCIVQFAKDLKIADTYCEFMAIDGLHKADILEGNIQLSMQNVTGFRKWESHFFLDTGSPQLVIFKESVDATEVVSEGRKLRYNKNIAENGCNITFVELLESNKLKIRTYERGVEDETWACGTGAIASAIAYTIQYQKSDIYNEIEVNTKGGDLIVRFKKEENVFSRVFLSGPAQFIYSGVYP
ncbi:MAG: diaminopimelate epimerase [Bacteroidetes bacterium]|nr:diaminopimelate epimerase [Bacteroidota bacterium]